MGMYDHPPYYLSAYGIAVKHGFVGTETQWLASLKGEKGDGLTILGSYDTLAELETALPSGQTGGFFRVGEEPDTLLYYWDGESGTWLALDLHGPAGEDGASAYEQAAAGGYTGTEQQFNTDLANFKTHATQAANSASAAAASATAAQTAKTKAETAAANASGSAEESAGSAQAAAGSASRAAASQQAATAAANVAAQYAAQAEASVGDASWIYFDIGEDGHLCAYSADTFTGADFSLSDNGHLEVAVA